MTAKEVKFSEAMSSMPEHCRRFSFSIKSWISGSTDSREELPHSLTGSISIERERNGNGNERNGRQWGK